MHHILDVMEDIAMTSRANAGGDKLERFFYEMYKPEPAEMIREFAIEDELDAFDAFSAAVGDMH